MLLVEEVEEVVDTSYENQQIPQMKVVVVVAVEAT